ncbi:TetR family transcriptional regulator [Yinghuangia sp. KLBMP8922]|uniref:TetR family transcriptional regulator n=1 Tax=Yinghuangia soli TaxID=2908204 RepID=A0AA41PZZ9_9ACTN|nr:TetR family transcriptional regulator [Yinghuangia soli]MCF2528948.1 TetR family transcriptional regulator [Yinghuangia soli]
MSSPSDIPMAQRKRQLVANELTEAALQLLAQRGFDAVTVDEIAAVAGVSKRTFFRYFASKEDVVVRFLADMGNGMRAELAARPAAEPPSVALRHTVAVPLAACGDHAERALPVVRLIMRTPALRARFLERQAQWRDDLSVELAARLGLEARDGAEAAAPAGLYPGLAAGMALVAFDAVLQQWSDGDGTADPAGLTDSAFAVLAASLDAVPERVVVPGAADQGRAANRTA